MIRLAYAVGFLVVPAVAYRLYFGIDFTDESYYLAVALRFLRGDVPFVDELFVNQTATLLAMPFYRVIHALWGVDGLVLHARFLYFGFSLLVGAAAYLALRERGTRLTAFLSSLVAVAFIPLNIPALSYNTLGGGFFAIALFTGLARRTFLAGTALALASFAYPPLLVADAVAAAIVIARSPDRKKTAWLIACAHACVGIAVFPYFARAGERLGDAVAYSLTAFAHGGGWRKLAVVLRELARDAYPRALPGIALLVAARFRPVFLVAAFPLLYLGFAGEIFPTIWAVTYFALGALLFPRVDRDIYLTVVVPSVVAGLVTAWASMSSVANVVIGLWPATIAATYLFATAAPRARIAVPAGVLASLVLGLYVGRVFYCDGEFSRLTARVGSGAFRGLYTTPEKKAYLDDVTRDVRALENPEGRVVFYEFPAGYLLTTMRPGVPESWMRTVARRKDFYVRYYGAHMDAHNLVFAFHILDHGYLSPVTYDMDDPFVALVRDSHRPILRRRNYDVFAPLPRERKDWRAGNELPRRFRRD